MAFVHLDYGFVLTSLWTSQEMLHCGDYNYWYDVTEMFMKVMYAKANSTMTNNYNKV